MKLDEAGPPTASPTRNQYYHFFNVKPGRYSVSVAVELGSGMTVTDPASGPRKDLFAAKGKWTGQLRTGVAAVAFFEDAGR